MTRAFTPHYGLVQPAFNSDPWADDLNGNASAIDTLIYQSLQVADTLGLWNNATVYAVGDRLIDEDGGQVWTALVAHTSSATGTFAADRVSYPTYWVAATLALTPRGEWANSTHYSENDIVYDTSEGVSAIARVSHTSSAPSATIRTDSANWTFIIDLAAGIVAADDTTYDHTTSGLTATDVQAAIDELVVSLALKATKASPTFTGTPLAPTAAIGTNTTQLATTAYVLAAIAALQLLNNYTVRLASTGNVVIASALENGDTIDGVVVATGNKVLLKDQTLPEQNGVYIVVASGAASRDPNFDSWAELVGLVANVSVGTANTGTSWRAGINSGGTLGTDPIPFTQFGSSLTLPVPIASGGTGTTTAALAFAALKQAATTAATGVVEQATVAEVYAGTVGKYPDAADMDDAGAYVALVDGATITIDFDTGINFKLDSIAGNRTLAVSNMSGHIGRTGIIRIKQDGTGSRTLASSGSDFINAGSTDITLSTAASAVDLIGYAIVDIGGVAKCFLTIQKAVG